MYDRKADICRQIGILQKAQGLDQAGAGYTASSVFTIDRSDRVRYHSVLDSRVAFNVGGYQQVGQGLPGDRRGRRRTPSSTRYFTQSISMGPSTEEASTPVRTRLMMKDLEQALSLMIKRLW